jgi:hypothetical protein
VGTVAFAILRRFVAAFIALLGLRLESTIKPPDAVFLQDLFIWRDIPQLHTEEKEEGTCV